MIQKTIVATTHVDGHNMMVTKEALIGAANQINSRVNAPAVGLEHDITLPPLGKVLSAEVSKMDDGKYKLEATMEIFDCEKRIELNSGEIYIKSSSISDIRPFIELEISEDECEVRCDIVNFESRLAYDEFTSSVKSDFKIGKPIIRKQLTPDPEMMLIITKGVFLVLIGNKVVEKVAERAIGTVLDKLGVFYNSVKRTVINYAKYATPKNRPITYVFITRDEFSIELVARTNNVDLLMRSIEQVKLKEVMNRIDDLKHKFSISKIQFVMDDKGNWKFNFLLTTDGTVIGTEKSFSERAKKMELFYDKKVSVSVSSNNIKQIEEN